MRRFALAAVALGAVGAVTAVAGFSTGNRAAEAARGPILTPFQQRLASGTLSRALNESSATAPAPLRAQQQANGPTTDTGCPVNRGANVRVNQDCQNLTDPDLQGAARRRTRPRSRRTRTTPAHRRRLAERLPARRRNCYTAYSADGGRDVGGLDAADGLHARRRLRRRCRASTGRPAGTRRWPGTRKGNAYLSCLMFMRGAAVVQQPGHVERVLRLPLDRHQRRLVELPGRPGRRAQRRRRAGDVAARQAVHDRRRPARAARSRTAST